MGCGVRRPVGSQRAALISAAAIEDIVREVSAKQWRERAHILEVCRPRPGDYRGRATDAELAEQDRRLAEAAQACRNRAAVIELDEG